MVGRVRRGCLPSNRGLNLRLPSPCPSWEPPAAMGLCEHSRPPFLQSNLNLSTAVELPRQNRVTADITVFILLGASWARAPEEMHSVPSNTGQSPDFESRDLGCCVHFLRLAEHISTPWGRGEA